MIRKFFLPLLSLICIYLIVHFSLNNQYMQYRKEGMPKTYSYYQLHSSEFSDSLYKALYYSITNHEDKIFFDPLTTCFAPEEVETIISVILDDYPEIFWLDPSTPISYTASSFTHHVMSVEFHYILSEEELLKNKTVMQINLVSLSEQLNMASSFEERMQIIREWINHNVTYNDTFAAAHTAYGAIAMKTACCDGISKAAQIALRSCGYEVNLTKGTVLVNGKEESHAWLYISGKDAGYCLADFTFALSHPGDTTHWYTPANQDGSPANANSIFGQYITDTSKKRFRFPLIADTSKKKVSVSA